MQDAGKRLQSLMSLIANLYKKILAVWPGIEKTFPEKALRLKFLEDSIKQFGLKSKIGLEMVKFNEETREMLVRIEVIRFRLYITSQSDKEIEVACELLPLA